MLLNLNQLTRQQKQDMKPHLFSLLLLFCMSSAKADFHYPMRSTAEGSLFGNWNALWFNTTAASTREDKTGAFALIPFSCTPQVAYLFQGTPTGVTEVNLVTGASAVASAQLIPGATNLQMNATGFNRTDNYIWGYRTNTNQVVRISSDWTVTTFPVTGLPTALNFTVGDVTANGVLCLYAPNTTTIYRVNVNPASGTYLQLLPNLTTSASNISDWAISPMDGNFYAVDNATRELYRFSSTTGARTVAGTLTGGGMPATGNLFGAAYMDDLGSLYISESNSGRIYKIANPHADFLNATLVATGPASTNSDGARCPSTVVPQPSFSCTPNTAYRVQSNASNQTDFYQINLVSGATTLVKSNVIPSAFSTLINPIGYNTRDNYIWGLRSSTSQLLRIGSDASVQVFFISGFSAAGYATGDISPNGVLYLYGVSGATEIIRLDLNPSSPTYLQRLSTLPTTGTFISDWAFSPVDGNIYALGDGNRILYRFNPATGARTTLGTVTGGGIETLSNNVFGTAFMDANGTFYVGANQTGNIYRIPNPHSGGLIATAMSNTPTAVGTDGARCPMSLVGTPTDHDGDGIADNADLDDDNDGIPDLVETGGTNPVADHDTDGIPNYQDPQFPGYTDSNADGVNDTFDKDKDGMIDIWDLDSDNDGIPDLIEAGGVDTNGDGRVDSNTDSDGDGLRDVYDTNAGGDAIPNLDTDNDGIANAKDLDSDNDGMPDIVETGGTDANNDGIPDLPITDLDGDGFVDAIDPVNNNSGAPTGSTPLLTTGTDTNSDGRPDAYPALHDLDGDTLPDLRDLDSDNDGIADVTEAGLTDANNDGRADGADTNANGWSDMVDGLPQLILPNSEGTGKPNTKDLDSDNDGITDNVEAQPTATYQLPGTTDQDGDGLLDTYDSQPFTPGGTGILPNDHDGDGLPDYMDADSDNDGLADRLEGHDLNGNGQPDDDVTPTGTDSDGDGIDNKFDLVAGPNATNAGMGNPPTPGAAGPLQMTIPGSPDRDWRNGNFVLPITLKSFTVKVVNCKALVNWVTETEENVARIELQHSTDDQQFTTIASFLPKGNYSSYSFTFDHLKDGNNYFRLRTVDRDGRSDLSKIIHLLSRCNSSVIRVLPNPAPDYIMVSGLTQGSTIRLISQEGRLINEITTRNSSQRIPVNHLPGGNYWVVIIRDNQIVKRFQVTH